MYNARTVAATVAMGEQVLFEKGHKDNIIYVVEMMELKSKTILMGFGLDSDAIHSPNEHFGIFNYLKGIETIPLFYKYFVELSK